jgi:hypothetical protein
MGRKHYQGAAQYFPGAVDHPCAAVINAARKVVFSHTIRTADWANTSIASGDLGAEIEKLSGTTELAFRRISRTPANDFQPEERLATDSGSDFRS